MRTLTFGDRTISYDVGLDTIVSESSLTSEQERKVSVASSESADSGVGDTGDNEEGDQETAGERRVIRPDDVAVRQLLNFDEVSR